MRYDWAYAFKKVVEIGNSETTWSGTRSDIFK